MAAMMETTTTTEASRRMEDESVVDLFRFAADDFRPDATATSSLSQPEQPGLSTLQQPQRPQQRQSRDPKKAAASLVRAQIESIPCKVCGDRSSGVHYGVFTCEGCKGFFRRSLAPGAVANYHCAMSRSCDVDRSSRNRCQYCRLQKCLALGMSKDAVKYGRMSKRQRQKVADEASMVGGGGGSEISSSRTPLFIRGSVKLDAESGQFFNKSSSHHRRPCYLGPISSIQELKGNGLDLTQSRLILASSDSASSSSTFASSPSSNSTFFPSSSSPLSSSSVASSSDSSSSFNFSELPSDAAKDIPRRSSPTPEADSSLADAVLEAHRRTCLYSEAELGRLLAIDADDSSGKSSPIYLAVKSRRDRLERRFFLWQEAVDQFSLSLQRIIEFAKMIPGFLRLTQDDQILLLKGAAFEIGVVRLSRLLDADTVVFGGARFPVAAFRNAAAAGAAESEERHLVLNVFEFCRNLRIMGLTERALALYCAAVLMTPDLGGCGGSAGSLRDAEGVVVAREAIVASLRSELRRSHSSEVDETLGKLLTRMAALRQISLSHSRVLKALTRELAEAETPRVRLPELYREIFRGETEEEEEEEEKEANCNQFERL